MRWRPFDCGPWTGFRGRTNKNNRREKPFLVNGAVFDTPGEREFNMQKGSMLRRSVLRGRAAGATCLVETEKIFEMQHVSWRSRDSLVIRP